MSDEELLADHEYDPVADIIEDEIARFVDQGYRTFLAGIGDYGDEPAQRKAAEQIRHLHLSQPWLPADRTHKRLRLAGLLKPEVPQADWQSAWGQLTGYLQEARDDGKPLVAGDVLVFMAELRREALRPVREWMDSTRRPQEDG